VYRLRLSRQLSRFFRMLWTQWAQTRGSQIAAHGQRSRSNHPPRAHQDWTAPFAVDEKSVESIRPNPAFRLVLESATTTEGPDDVLIRSDDTGQGGGVELGTPNQLPPGGQEADVPRSWWRRGRVELPVQKTPRSRYTTSLASILFSLRRALTGVGMHWSQPMVLGHAHRHRRDSTPIYVAHSPPSEIGGGGRNRLKRLVLAGYRQLIVCHLFTR